MTLEESWNAIVTRSEAQQEIKRHGCDFDEFLADCGDFAEYRGGTVLGWLGY